MGRLSFRQIHLDFHTSEQIPGIGAEFDADEFVGTLQRARVGSATLFSRCHHGMIYHDTKFPAQHPHLTCNLLGEQIAACHRVGIRCPIYITVGWDEYMAREHPEWREVLEDGRLVGAPPLQPGWKLLDFASDYLDYVVEQTNEVFDLFGDEVDGIFYDIMFQQGVHSPACLKVFAELGLNPAEREHQEQVRRTVVSRAIRRLTDAVRARSRTCSLFHNAGHIYPRFREVKDCFTHWELESLPSGGWGYAHFPVSQRYARGMGLECLGMTGKFAVTWGHFNSYKDQAALEYECFHMLALGAQCSIGDQLHPSGRLDPATYDLIGAVYTQVEAKEAWCAEAEPVTEIGVVNVEALGVDARVPESSQGAYRILADARHQFDIIDLEHEWSRYALIILPDLCPAVPALVERVEAHLARGGAVIATGRSGLNEAGDAFGIAALPVEYRGELPYHPDFVKPLGSLGDGLREAEYVMYQRGVKVVARPGAEVLGEIWEPYFNRTWERFCSHFHTPVRGRGGDPAVVQAGRVIYFAHPIFFTYAKSGMPFYAQVMRNAIDRLLPEPLVRCDGPSSLHVSWNRQPAQRRSVVHLLHYIPEQRTLGPATVHDVIPLFNLTLELRTPPPRRIYLAPQGDELPFASTGGYVQVNVPEVRGHQMVVLEE